MVPREVAMTLAKLENEKIWLQELILNEVQEARNRIYAKYAPQMSAIQEAIDQHKTLIAGHGASMIARAITPRRIPRRR